MDPAALIAPTEALPAAPGLFATLLTASFAAHILVVNAVFGLTLLATIQALAKTRGPDPAGSLTGLTALAVNLGVAPLLFVQAVYGQFMYPGSTLMGAWWFAMALAVMLAYALAYRQKALAARGENPAWLWTAMSLCLLYASLMQTHNAILLLRPDLWPGYFDTPTGHLLAWSDPTFAPRWLHFVTASLAVGGLATALAAKDKAARGDAQARERVRRGMAWFAWASLAQAADGLWFLVSLPREVMLAFMTGDPAARGVFVAGLTLVGLTLVLGFRAKVAASAASLAATVCLMVLLREIARRAYLKPFYDPRAQPVNPEPASLALFLACLVLALAAVAWAVWPTKRPRGA